MDSKAAVDPLASELDKRTVTGVAVGASGVKCGVDLLLAYVIDEAVCQRIIPKKPRALPQQARSRGKPRGTWC